MDTRGQTGMTSGKDRKANARGEQRRIRRHSYAYATDTYQAHADDADASSAGALKGGQNLGPDGDHAEKQADGSKSGGFFDNGAKHRILHERRENIVHRLF